jgi:predicted ATPase
MGIRDAQVLSFDDGSVHEVDWRQTDAVRVMRDYLAERLG